MRWSLAAVLALAAACLPVARAPSSDPVVVRKPPPKPGDSLTKTMMCSCPSCEPADCCRELERQAPPIASGCAEGYDFSRCKTEVQSCESRCFQHRWRTRIELGCEQSRPSRCCPAGNE